MSAKHILYSFTDGEGNELDDAAKAEQLKKAQAAVKLLSQTVRHVRPSIMELLLGTFDKLIRSVPIYRLGCVNDVSAAEVSSNTMIINER